VETARENPLWSDRRVLMAMIIIYALIHIPFIGIGFGEPDAWRNGLAALNIGQGYGYAPNRVPGFPVVELCFGFLAKWVPAETLWIYTNGLTLLISLAGIYFFFKIAQYHKTPHPLIPVLALYFIPVIFINTAFSMDNLWAMTFILIAYWCLLKVRPFWAGLFFALAIGSRLTSAIFIFPFLVCLVWNPGVFPKKESLRGTVWLLLSVFVLALIYFFMNYYLFVNFNPFGYLKENVVISRDYMRSGYYVLQEVFGLPGTLFLIGIAAWHWKKFPPRNWEFWFLILTVLLFLSLFLYRPEKPAYLIPLFPFLFLWISRWLKGIFCYLLTGLIILNNIISFGVVEPTPEGLSLNKIDKGISWKTYQRYQKYRQDVDYLIQFPYLPDTEVELGYRNPGVLFFLELPAYQKRKAELRNNQIAFPDHLGREKKKNTYWVFGSLSYKQERQFLSSKNYRVIYLPASQPGP
jgi:hypothetical protein